jgi:hypothetical protein
VRPLFGQRVDHPILVARCYNHFPVSKKPKVLRNFYLWLTENVLEVANAEWRSCKEMENAQSRAIAKALIDLDQVHIA